MIKKYSPTQQTGYKAEKIACKFLLQKGLCLLYSNYFTHFGEIDLIMEDAKTLVFVEVRYRKSIHYGQASESVNKAKQKRIIKSAARYLQQYPTWKATRFDVISIHKAKTEQPSRLKWKLLAKNEYVIDWIKDAFQVQ